MTNAAIRSAMARLRSKSESGTTTQKLNCTVGDLAIVVGAELLQNLGQIVEVLSVQTGRPFSLKGCGHVWQVRTVSGRAGLFYRYRDTGITVRHEIGPVPDRCLRVINPAERPEVGVIAAEMAA